MVDLEGVEAYAPCTPPQLARIEVYGGPFAVDGVLVSSLLVKCLLLFRWMHVWMGFVRALDVSFAYHSSYVCLFSFMRRAPSTASSACVASELRAALRLCPPLSKRYAFPVFGQNVSLGFLLLIGYLPPPVMSCGDLSWQ